MAQKFQKFRQLLDEAICRRTQAQFAKDAHISAEHLNRMLNSPEISRPTNATIKKIAAVAENGITYKDFIDALDSEDPNYKKVDYTHLKNEEAARDFSPTFEQRAKECYAILADIVEKRKPAVVSSLNAYMEDLLRDYNDECSSAGIEPMEISYYIPEEHYKYFGHKFETEDDNTSNPSIEFRSILLSSAEDVRITENRITDSRTAESEILIYTMNMPLMTAQFPYMVIGATMAVRDLFEVYGLYRDMCGDIEYDACMDLEAALSQPFYLSFNKLESRYEWSAEETANMLKSLFAAPVEELPTCTTGLGFYTDNIPTEKFYGFIKNHTDTFLSDFYSDSSEFKEISDGLEQIFKKTDDDRNASEDGKWADRFMMAFKELAADYYGTEIIADVIATIMRAETGFICAHITPSKSEKYKDILSTRPCVLLTDDSVYPTLVHKTTIMNILARYGKELGIKYFGEIRYVWMQRFFEKPEHYKIKTEESKQQSCQEEVDTSSWSSIDTKPQQIGLYDVLLKDGRRMTCTYIPTHNVWIKLHREWSDLIDKWYPKVVSPLPDAAKSNTTQQSNIVEGIKSASNSSKKNGQEGST